MLSIRADIAPGIVYRNVLEVGYESELQQVGVGGSSVSDRVVTGSVTLSQEVRT